MVSLIGLVHTKSQASEKVRYPESITHQWHAPQLAGVKGTTLLIKSWQNYALPANLTVAPTSFALSIHSIANIWSRPGSKPISLITVIPAASTLKITEMQSCQNIHYYWPSIQEICLTKAQRTFPNTVNSGLCLQLGEKKPEAVVKTWMVTIV